MFAGRRTKKKGKKRGEKRQQQQEQKIHDRERADQSESLIGNTLHNTMDKMDKKKEKGNIVIQETPPMKMPVTITIYKLCMYITFLGRIGCHFGGTT